MKSKLKKLSFVLLLSLVSCNGSNTSSDSSTTSRPAPSQTLTQEMLDKLASGYQTRAILSYSVVQVVMSQQYLEVASKSNAYTFKGYKESTDKPTLDVVDTSYRYEPEKIGRTSYVHQVELGFDNQIKKYPVTDQNGNKLAWASAGFGNCFNKIKLSDFVKGEEEYSFRLKVNLLSQSITNALATQFAGMMGLTLGELIFYSDGYDITKFSITYAPISSLLGDMVYQVSGDFVKYGNDAIEEITPIQGTDDKSFDEAMSKLKKHNFKLDYKKPGQTLKISCEGDSKILYDVYNSKNQKTSSYGYYQVNEKSIQGVTKIGDNVYKDGQSFEGSVLTALPSFDISSKFFNKSSQSTDKKLVYTYREDVSKDIPLPSDYGMLNGSNVGDLTITIEDDSITILNKLKLGEEVFKYYDIGKVSGLISNIKDNCDDLTWSQLVSNQPSDDEKLFKIIPKDALDKIPTIGGVYSYVVLDVESTPVFTILVDDNATGNALIKSYADKLKEHGFNLDESNTLTGDLYLKSVEINGQTHKIGARIFYAAEFLNASKVVIYPTYE